MPPVLRTYFLAASGARYDHVLDPMSVELLACRDAVLFAPDRGLHRVLVETDCQEVKGLCVSSSEKSGGYHILRVMKEIVSSFHGFKLLFVLHEANVAAHNTTKEDLSSKNLVLNFDVILGFLTRFPRSDMPLSIE